MQIKSGQQFKIREATPQDVLAIARVHVEAFKETHGRFNAPKFPLRLVQWTGLFAKNDGTWFMYVVEDEARELVGFLKCNFPQSDEDPTEGHLHKIYILRKFHRDGIGKRLLGLASRRFLEKGVTSRHLFGEARNPSNAFYERMGAERMFGDKGEFHGGYRWNDLARLPRCVRAISSRRPCYRLETAKRSTIPWLC